jgi:hypothetical protein
VVDPTQRHMEIPSIRMSSNLVQTRHLKSDISVLFLEILSLFYQMPMSLTANIFFKIYLHDLGRRMNGKPTYFAQEKRKKRNIE